MTVHPKVDVATLGAGWSAGILAQQLTAAGLRVVSIEQGPARWTYPDFSTTMITYAIRCAKR